MSELKLMFPRRLMRVTAAALAVAMAVAVGLGFDFHLGTNITETMVDSIGGCF